ncbi:tripartite motif-containing protein 16-like protein [Brachionichthys hirsutus]|uniref:tripartite motif-containing protein 16-like protein n=1 Tax=Brachionichthys hirsutus TaxID=412623 RepID=UPI00360470C4
MTQKEVQMDQENFSCSICLDLLKDPVPSSCGHRYCMTCIKANWDEEGEEQIFCPQCMEKVASSPVLHKNTMLTVLEEDLNKIGVQAAPADPRCAGPEDVACDVGTAEVSPDPYCEKPLQVSQPNIQKIIQDTKKDVNELQREVEGINRYANQTVEDSEKIFTEMIRLIIERRRDVKQQVRSQQQKEVSRVKEFQEKKEEQINELEKLEAELEQLSHVDHIQFLENRPLLSALSDPTRSSSISIRPLRYFEDVAAVMSKLRDQVQDVLNEGQTDFSLTGPTEPEPKTRSEFIQYSCEITLDPDTANAQLLLSDGNRKVRTVREAQGYAHHPERFSYYGQVLSKESLTGCCYWEVEWGDGEGGVAVAYKDISRGGESQQSLFGRNDRSWMLYGTSNNYQFYHDTLVTPVSGPWSSRVGVYLDHGAGILSFYCVSEMMTLLHRVQTTFTQPLYVGLRPYFNGTTAELCELK